MSLATQIGIGMAVVLVMAVAHYFIFAAVHRKFGCAFGRLTTRGKAVIGGGVMTFLSVALYLHFEGAKALFYKLLY